MDTLILASYLPALREYHQATKKSQPTVVKEKDVVLLHDEKPRKEWKLVIVENLIRSTDGEIRAADIRTANGKTNRPISTLYPLQMTEPANAPAEILSGPANVPARSRPVRKCAIKYVNFFFTFLPPSPPSCHKSFTLLKKVRHKFETSINYIIPLDNN